MVFASRCIDAWWQSGGVQDQAEMRMHDLSDGFVSWGAFAAALSVNTGATELRSDDGSTFLRLDPASQKVKIVAPGGFEVVAPVSEFSDQVLVRGCSATSPAWSAAAARAAPRASPVRST